MSRKEVIMGLVPVVCQLELCVIPHVQDVTDGGVEVLVEIGEIGEEGIMDEASPFRVGEGHVPRTPKSSTVTTLETR